MATTEFFSYPVFTKGQQLKSSDLNNIVAYIELEDRLTRTQFIGSGIMNGLDVSWVEDNDGKRLVIGKGAGISSAGYLLYQAEAIAFTKYEKTELSLGKILENNSLDKFPAWKLTNAEDENLDTVFPITDDCGDETCNKCVLALREMKTSSTNGGCFNGLETASKKANFEIVYYLVDHNLIGSLPALPLAGEYKISFKDLPAPGFPRLGFESAGLDLSKIEDLAKFKAAFTTVCKQGIDSLNEAFKELETKFGAAPNPEENIKFDTFQEDLEAVLAKCAEGNGYKLPYFYEFLEDLLKAYQELVGMGEVSIVHPTVNVEEDWFPHHLLLGCSGNLKPKGRTPKYCAGNCNPPPTGNGDKARFLYRRLYELTQNTSFDELATTPGIVPGKSYDHPLSNRAIPFYYKPAVRPSWNYELTQQDKAHLIPSYFPLPDSDNALFADPLLYELKSWGFFRVEGHANLPLEDAIAKIEAERKRLNIAFDIISVPLEEKTQKFHPATIFEDLECAFHQLRLEWILDLQTNKETVEKADKLLKFLQDMEGRKLHELDIKALSDAVDTTEEAEDCCKYDVVVHLHETYLARTTAPVFHQFAESHPGLEHLGGVQPGGTLVLVYDNSLTPDQPEEGAASDITQVVVADFCLPYLCCSKQQVGIPPAIFGFFPSKKLCFNDLPQEIFTWPSGGRVLVRSEGNKYFRDAAAISPLSGKWTFSPAGLPDEAFNERGEATVKLSFMHLGKQIEIAEMVFVSRVTPRFKASAFWGIEKSVVHVRVEDIQLKNAVSSQWTSTLLMDKLPLKGQEKPITGSMPPSEIKRTSREFPTHVLITLEATGMHSCKTPFTFKSKVFIAPPPDQESRSIEKTNPPEKSDDSTKKGNDESGGQAERSGEPPDNHRQIGDNSEQLELEAMVDKRLKAYQSRYKALLKKEKEADNTSEINYKFFVHNQPGSKMTDFRFRNISESLMENFASLHPSDRERRKEMIEVLAHCFLDRLYFNRPRLLDATVFPNRESLERNGINTRALLGSWRVDELLTGGAQGMASR